jgi:tetratricopeptide (TPR) repeat protein
MRPRGLLTALLGVSAITLCAAVDLGKAGDLWSQSVALEQKSDYKGALAKIAEMKRGGADLYLSSLRTAWLSYENKDYDTAVTNYQAAAGREPAAVSPVLGLATAYRAKGDNDNAEHACRNVLSKDPANVTALQMLGSIYFDKKDYQNASVVYDTLRKLYPEDPAALSGYGWAKIYLNRKADALPAFQRLLIVAPTYAYAQDGYAAATTP